jgi:DUF4097 and DUF4098 domain-containing protein YvlB
MRRFFIVAVLVSATSSLSAQSDRAAQFMDNCSHRQWDDDERACDVRTLTLPQAQSLNVDGRQNGSVTVHGWDKPQIQVIAMVEAHARTESDAQALAKEVTVQTTGASIRAEGPYTRNRNSWSVSYEVYVPRHTNLDLVASNGGVSVDGVDARMELRSTNGGLHLTDVAGDVRGTTTNGGVSAELSGRGWSGAGLNLRTTNGGVRLTIPENYSANLETGTEHGSISSDIPITVHGRLNRMISTEIGNGGAPISVTTPNGGVSIRRR